MRIIIATTYTIPCFSGGWTTPLDLLGTDHSAMYVVRNYPPVTRVMEGVKVVGIGAAGPLKNRWYKLERYKNAIIDRLFARVLRRNFSSFNADFVLCLDPCAGFTARSAGLPYAMRFHSSVDSVLAPVLQSLVDDALFSTACHGTHIEGTTPIPHNQDLSRFTFNNHEAAERAVLLTSINPFREPELFIEGIMLSNNMKGDIVGTGDNVRKIRNMCRKTDGRVRVLDPVPRLKVPDLLSNYQIGVATVKKVPFHYQMKVNAYMASGLFTLAKPWTHISIEAPELVRTFETAEDLAEQLDYVKANWHQTLETRQQARNWAHEHYSVELSRKVFRKVLRQAFS